jgi:hypothetical protein
VKNEIEEGMREKDAKEKAQEAMAQAKAESA